jgi:hypothetical protein
MSREHRILVSGWIAGVIGIMAAIGWASSLDAFMNLMLTLGAIVLAITSWIGSR